MAGVLGVKYVKSLGKYNRCVEERWSKPYGGHREHMELKGGGGVFEGPAFPRTHGLLCAGSGPVAPGVSLAGTLI